MPEQLRIGILGAAWIADRALIPAMLAARNASPVAIASRDVDRARGMAGSHGIRAAHANYESLLDDPSVDAVYIALVNSAHREWTLRALDAGKHVLCEKPLGVNAEETRDMARAAQRAGRTLMEAFMYRFHPRMRALRESAGQVRSLHAAFSFPLPPANNYRWSAALGGGALLDVGCYTLDVARWFLGEPDAVTAVMAGDEVDVSVAAALGFGSGAQATVWASFAAPEHQVLELVGADGIEHVTQPFTAWRDPDDPYQLMVEEFAASVLEGRPPPRSLDDSIGTADLIDRVRAAASPVSAGAAR
ncbi:MAG: Gfo/Idh/MocA family oxidoreductase [Candidatus Dormibacteraeota bacterium]|nr:Gfo/Idh/MocA family oxidoreductase [Candidatus Dormibacteraeota bacterium]MBV9526550.1 Gfo/Idh/MocA family oxidoreductase [Candidatus Dormibacteraeota bacterium]